MSPEMNVSSGVSKVNINYMYLAKTLLVSGNPNDPYILGPPFLEMFWDVQYSNLTIF